MPEEILAIILVSIFAFTLMSIIKMILNYRKSRFTTTSNEGSMTTSQLEGMIKKAVKEANVPLTQQIEGLEDQLDALLVQMPRQLQEKSELIEEVEEFELEEAPQPVRRRSRTR